MNQDKRQQGSEMGKNQDQAANKSRPGERSTTEQQSGQEHGGGRQQGGPGGQGPGGQGQGGEQRDRGESGGRGGQQR